MLARPRGVRDLFGNATAKLSKLEYLGKETAEFWGYQELRVPSIELKELYVRGLGSASDIVHKEMFEIKDSDLVLRPEGTAGAMRCFLAQHARNDSKLWHYTGSMFRHERPQNGRYREFFQFGVENIGQKASPAVDVNVILMASAFLAKAGVKTTLRLNSLGDSASRQAYTHILTDFFELNYSSLSELSKLRLKTNPLRILDSKELQDTEVIKQAPRYSSYLRPAACEYFDEVKGMLKDLEVDFIEDSTLVRGLDYYSHTCFEFEAGGKAVLAGGRYDGLATMIDGGTEVPAIGWAAGLDRISDLQDVNLTPRRIGVVTISDDVFCSALKILKELPQHLKFVLCPGAKLKQQLAYVNKMSATHCIIVGPDELAVSSVIVKDFKTGTQQHVHIDELAGFLLTLQE